MSQARAPILHLRNGAHLRLQDSSTPCSTCASCACGQVAPDPRASASRCPTPWPDGQKLLVTGAGNRRRHDRAHRAFASKVVASMATRLPTISPRRASTSNTQANTARASPDRSAAGCAKSSSGPAWPRPAQCHKRRSASRIRQAPGDAALGSNAFEIPYQQRAKVNARRQRRTSKLRRIELRATILDKPVKAFRIQHGVQTLIKRMPPAQWPIPYAPPTNPLAALDAAACPSP